MDKLHFHKTVKANKITHNIVHGILNDPYINAEVTRLLSNVVQSDQVRSSSILLVNNLLAAERKHSNILDYFSLRENSMTTQKTQPTLLLMYFWNVLKAFKNLLENYYMTN